MLSQGATPDVSRSGNRNAWVVALTTVSDLVVVVALRIRKRVILAGTVAVPVSMLDTVMKMGVSVVIMIITRVGAHRIPEPAIDVREQKARSCAEDNRKPLHFAYCTVSGTANNLAFPNVGVVTIPLPCRNRQC